VLQAIVATVAVFAATLVLYSLGKFRVSAAVARFVIVGLMAVFLIWLSAFAPSLFGINFRFLYQPTPVGILLSLVIVVNWPRRARGPFGRRGQRKRGHLT